MIRRLSWLLLIATPFVLQRLLVPASDWVETIYARQVFPRLSWPLRTATSFVPFSLTESVVLLLPLLLLVWLLLCWQALRRRQGRSFLRQSARNLVVILALGSWLFMLLHGFNYLRQPVAQSFNLPAKARPGSDLESLGFWLTNQASTARQACQEDSTGVFTLQQSVPETLQLARLGYERAATRYPLLRGATARPKSVGLSHYWSYTGITGMYMPFWVEANVNTDQPAYLLPATVNHELAHTIGFAREDEAGFIGFLAGTANPMPDYRYSSYVEALVHVLNSLEAVDPDGYARLTRQVPASIWRDIAAANAYWQKFQGPVEKASTEVNHSFLKANLQTDGVYSYGRMVDLLLAWYEKNQSQATLPEALT